MTDRRRAAILLALVVTLPLLPPLLRGHVLTLRDHTDYFIPMRVFTAEVLRSGELPLWNPYNGGGERWLANPQTAVFYPPAWLFLFLPLPSAYLLFLGFHLALLAVGCFALFRRWSEYPAAAFGALGAALSGSTMSLLDVGNNLASLAWLPWIADMALQREPDRRSVKPAVLLAFCFLGGEPLIAVIGAAMWAGVLVFRFRRGALRAIVVTGVTTVGLSAVQLLPFLEYLAGSDRAAGLKPDLAFSQTASLRDWSSVAVAPWAFASGGLPALSQSFIPSLYAGIPIVLGALIAAFNVMRFRREDRRSAVAATSLMAILAVSIIVSTAPQWGWARDVIVQFHLNVSRYPARMVPLGMLALCGLAALGLDRLSSASAPSRFSASALFIAILAIFGAASRTASGPAWRPLLGFSVIALWIAAVAFFPRVFQRRTVIAAAGLILLVDLYAANRPFLESGPFVRRSAPYASVISGDRRFARLPPRSLLFDRVAWMAGYRNLLDRKFDLSSPAPAIPEKYLELHDDALYGPRFDILRFMSADYLITERALNLPAIAAADGAIVRGLPRSLPFAVAWRRFETAVSDDEAWRRIKRGPIDEAIITGGNVTPITSALTSTEIPSAPAFSATGVTMRIRSETPVVLTLNQLDARGWTVSIDGARAPSLRANSLFRAVSVPAGEHLVEWRYRPSSFFAGAFFSLTTMTFLLARNAQQMRKTRSKNSSFHRASL